MLVLDLNAVNIHIKYSDYQYTTTNVRCQVLRMRKMRKFHFFH